MIFRHLSSYIASLQSISKLFLNHMDAWGVTLAITMVALLIHNRVDFQSISLIMAITISYWLGFALNDYFDASIDAKDAKKAATNFFVNNPISKNKIILGFLCIGTLLFIVFAQFQHKGILIFAIGFFIMWAYSAPPLRLKSRAGLDLLSHSLFVETFPYFVCLVLINVYWTRLDYVILSMLFFASLAAQLEQQTRDFESDSKVDTNFATQFGFKKTLFLLKLTTSILGIITIVNTANGTIPPWLIPVVLIALPIMMHRFIRAFDEARSERLVNMCMGIGLFYISAVFVYSLT